jgi:hypothetical protein
VTIARWLRGTSPEQRASDIATALALAASRPQEIDVAATYPLAQITDAVREVNRGRETRHGDRSAVSTRHVGVS